jgi:hypothetical protein
LCDDASEGRIICNDVLRQLARNVVSDARHVVKTELRRNVLERLERDGQKDIDFSVGLIMQEQMQQILGKYLAALRNKSK